MKIYKLIDKMIYDWDNYLCANCNLFQNENFDNAVNFILDRNADIIEKNSSLLSILHNGDCCAPLFHHLLSDRQAEYNRRNDLILEKTKDRLEDYVKLYGE